MVERLQGSGDLELSGIADLVQQLRVGNFLDTPFVDTAAAVRQALSPASPARRKARQFASTLSVDWNGAERLVAWFYRHGLRWFFHRLGWLDGRAGPVVGFAPSSTLARPTGSPSGGSSAVAVCSSSWP